jgi:HD-GYP domain-containing protein (c-di-GMP phosphodiesterase class II)
LVIRKQQPEEPVVEVAFGDVAESGTPITVSRDYYQAPTGFRRELKKAEPVYQQLSQAASEVIGGARVGRSLDPEPLRKPVKEMVQSIIRHPDALVWKRKLDNQPSYLTGHSIRNSVLTVVLARDMGLPEVQLERAAMAALLAQIGKTKLPRSLLEKQEPLSDEDLERIRGFIGLGVEILRECQTVGEDVVEVVQSHQERFDGSGYPNGLSGDAIPVLSRLLGLADWYDAATTRKPHTSIVLSPNEAMDELYRQRGKLFQPQVVEEFIRGLGIYPCGNLVKLNTNEVALIQAQNLDNRTQPVILMVLDRAGKPFPTFERIDLFEHNQKTLDHPLTVKRVLAAGELDLDPNDIISKAVEQKSGWRKLLGR